MSLLIIVGLLVLVVASFITGMIFVCHCWAEIPQEAFLKFLSPEERSAYRSLVEKHAEFRQASKETK